MIKSLLQPIDYALITSRHLQAALGRISGASMHVHRADQNDDNEQDDFLPDVWWKHFDVFGDKLPAPSVVGKTALIPIKGVITSGYPTIARAFGFADTDEIAGWLTAAANNTSINRIVLSIDSPGGLITGTPELAALVADISREALPVFAHTSGMMDSAAYWIASQADMIYCTPSADVGCIGVYQMHYDWSRFMQEAGIDVTMFKSGDLKGTGHEDVPMSPEQAARIQTQIEIIGEQFRSAVRSKRSLVQEDSMRGDSFIGTDAAARNLVGGLCSLKALL